MKIVIVETDSMGGLIHFAYQLAEALAAAGADVTLITGRDYELAALPHRCRVRPILRLWPPVEPPPRSALAARLRRTLWPLRRAWRAAVLAREWARLTREIHRIHPDVALFSSIRFRFLALFLRALARDGIPLAQLCHEFANREAAPGPAARLAGALLPSPYGFFSSIFLFSAPAARAFRRAVPEAAGKVRALPHGPELIFDPAPGDAAALDARYALAPSDRIVLMFGGLRPSKGVSDLIEAFARLPDTPGTRLLIAGYPSREFDTGAAQESLARLGLAQRATLDFRYLGRTELGALIRRAAVVVFPYRSATSSGALALAMSLGRPVVATSAGGLADAMEDGVTGRLVPPEDPEALARAISDLLAAPEAAEALARRGRQVILSDRSWPAIAARMIATLEADRPAPAPQAAGRPAPEGG